ncbi:MAG: septum formation family protein, partial [Acidimicrobiales bacterium]
GLAGCGDNEPERDDEGAVAEEGDLAASSVKVGDCFDDPGNLDDVEAVPAVPCDQPHANEAYYAFDLDGDDFPGTEQVEELAIDGCLAEFEAFVGTPYEESTLDIFYLAPSTSSWDDFDDREVLCAVYGVDGEPLTSPARDSGL